MGAWPMENSRMVCGTLSSRIRKSFRGSAGTKLFLLSTTATSTVTRLVSAEKVALAGPPSSLGLGASFEGIFGRSVEVAAGAGAAGADVSAAGLRGRATVSLPTDVGPSCAKRQANRASRIANATISLFITKLQCSDAERAKGVSLLLVHPRSLVLTLLLHIYLKFLLGALH